MRWPPHPSMTLLCADYPVDVIWRGVLGGDDAALAAVDLGAGPVRLLVKRGAAGVEVSRLDDAAWRFAVALCEGRPLAELFAACTSPALAREHGRAGRGQEVWLARASCSWPVC